MANFIFQINLIIIFTNIVNCYYFTRRCPVSLTRVHKNSTLFYRPRYCSGELIFSDEFSKYDSKIWHSNVGPMSKSLVDFQKYVDSRENSYTQDGILFIRPTIFSRFNYFNWHLPYDHNSLYEMVHSARLSTLASLLFKYGRLEIRAKLPTGDWLWPALWLMPKEKPFGEWPRCGEIDIMESRGNRGLWVNNKNIGVNEMGATLHFGPSAKFNGWRKAHFVEQRSNFNTKFHNYTLIWSPYGFEFYLNDQLFGYIYPPTGGFWKLGRFSKQTTLPNPWLNESPIAPFNEYFYIIMNVAVGGITGYFPDNAFNLNYPKPWKNKFGNAREDFLKAKHLWLPTWPYMSSNGEDSALQVDYVRLYAL